MLLQRSIKSYCFSAYPREPLIKSNYFRLAKSADISPEDRSNSPLLLLTSKKIATLFSTPNSNRLNQRLPRDFAAQGRKYEFTSINEYFLTPKCKFLEQAEK